MTFKDFETIVKQYYPQANVYMHNGYEQDMHDRTSVAVIFNPNSKVYQYNGNYVEILNKLKIKAVYKKTVENLKSSIEQLEKENGTKCIFFGFTIDNTETINAQRELLKDYESNYIICNG